MSTQLPAELVILIRDVLQPSGHADVAAFASKQAALTAAQEASEAWNWTAAALSQSQNDPYVRFWGAHTLHRKIEREFSALAAESRAALRVSLLEWLALSCYRSYETNDPSASSERIVLRKLASALALLAIFSRADNEWDGWAKETVEMLSSERFPSRQGLFEVLAERAKEERELPKAKMKNGKKGPVSALSASDLQSIDIAGLLSSALSPGNPAATSALRCLSELMTRDLVSQETLSTVYPLLPPLLGHEATMDLSAGIIEDCLIKCTSFSGFMTRDRVDALATEFANSLSASFAALTSEDGADSLPLPLIKLFVTLLEALILDNVSQRLLEPVVQQLLRNLLCLSTAAGRFGVDEEESNLGFPLWLLLQEEAASAGIRQGSEHANAWQALHAIFASLWPTLIGKVKLGSDQEWAALPKDVRERFQDYRREAAEVFLATYWVLRDEMLQQVVEGCLNDANADVVEALLFVLSTIARAELRSSQKAPELASLEQLFSSYTFSSSGSTSRAISEIDCIGACSMWLNKHPEHLLKSLNHLVNCLQGASTAHAASKALQQMCKHCASHMAQHLESFAGLIASSYGHLPSEDFAALVGAVGTILEELRTETAGRATMSIGTELMRQLSADIERLASMQPNDRMYGLEAFCAFAKSISHSDVDLYDLDGDYVTDPFSDQGQSPAILEMRRQLYDALSRLARHVAAIGQVERMQDLEALCLALTSSSTPTALSIDSLAVLEASSPCASQSLWLLCASRLVHRVSRDGSLQGDRLQRLSRVNQAICQGALSGQQSSDPDLVQALLSLQTDVLRSAPAALTQTPDLVDLLLRGAASALTSAERPTARAAVEFASSMILEDSSTTREAFAAHARALIEAALRRFFSNKDDCSLMAELFQAANNRMPDLLRSSLIEVLRSAEWRLTDEDKTRGLNALMKAKTVKTVTAALEDLVRSVQA